MSSRARRSLVTDRLRASLWVVPSSFIAGAVALAVATITLDRALGDIPLDRWGFAVGAEGTRATLATIAGSVMTVTGVAFSTTIIVLQLASTQYSPRVIRSFRRDRVIQGVLGVLCATFVYCLIVLRSITAEGEGPAFTAPLSVTVAMMLGIAALLAIVAMVHHVADNVRVAAILRNIAVETRAAVERAWPETLGADPIEEVSAAPSPGTTACACCRADRDGYVDYVDAERLERVAGARVIRLEVMVGDFVRRGDVLATSWPVRCEPEELPVDERALVDAFALADERTISQDPRYGVWLIVDVALRALSPGIQDPRTAVECVDTLGALLCRAATRRVPDPLRRTPHAIVFAPRPDLAALVALAFDEIVSSAQGSMPVYRAVVSALAAIARRAPGESAAAAIRRTRDRIAEELGAVRIAAADRAEMVRELAALGATEPDGRARPC